MDYKIVHHTEKQRFETVLNGMTAFVEYNLLDNGLDIIHTVVPPEIGGRGIAASLVQATYDYALANGLKPLASCSYAAAWLQRHPEYTQY